MHRVFVYGKLRKGFWWDLLLRDAEYLGPARTRNRFALYRSAMPYVTTEEAVSPIVGDAYRVDDSTLHELDLFKGHPHWFQRTEVAIVLENRQGCLAWLYSHPRIGGELIESGDFYPEKRSPVGCGAWGNTNESEVEGGAL